MVNNVDEWNKLNIPWYVEPNKDNNRIVEERDESGDEEDSDSSSSNTTIPDWVIEEKIRFSNWRYVPEQEIIEHIKLRKKVSLSSLNSSHIILKLISNFYIDQSFEADNFIIELEKVCFIKYNKSLKDVVTSHPNFAILWNEKKENELIQKRNEELRKKKENKITYDDLNIQYVDELDKKNKLKHDT